jgi:hypothetical protein
VYYSGEYAINSDGNANKRYLATGDSQIAGVSFTGEEFTPHDLINVQRLFLRHCQITIHIAVGRLSLRITADVRSKEGLVYV